MIRKVLLVAIGVFTLSGCGGSTKPTLSTAKPNATAAFESRVDAVCLNGEKRIFGTVKSASPSLARIGAGRSRIADELSRLRPPAALSASYRLFVSLIGRDATLDRGIEHALHTQNYASAIADERTKRNIPLAKEALLLNVTKCV